MDYIGCARHFHYDIGVRFTKRKDFYNGEVYQKTGHVILKSLE